MQDAWLPYALSDLPRYTSYPTAVQFHDGVGETQAKAWLAATGQSAQSLSLYFHIPFCHRLCWYCGCHTYVVIKAERVAGYVDLLDQEMALQARLLGRDVPVTTVHFGGGTPTFLTPPQWCQLLAAVRRHFTLAPDAELAVEIDPRQLDQARIAALAESGVNRASLGVQTFAPEVQTAIDRQQPFEMVARCAEALRGAGIKQLSFDLMYGLPRQSLQDVEDSCRLAAQLSPQRLAVFGYAHVPWMKKHQRAIQDADLPGARARWDQAAVAADTLVSLGYRRIGFDHFALPNDAMTRAAESGALRRNFQGYTTDQAEALLAFGVSAIGALADGYVQNLKELPRYADAVRAGHLPLARGVALSADDKLRRHAIERLLCDLVLNLGAVCKAHGQSEDTLDNALPALRTLEADGLVTFEAPRRLKIPEAARNLMRHAAAAFDLYRRPQPQRHSRAV